ncbi:MAG: class I SAM-dependent methyltransferase [Minisyncoccota bacterium]
MRAEYANKILEASRAGYEKIAVDFSRTRGAFWPELLFVRDLIPDGSRLLDIGCGNGRFLGALDAPPRPPFQAHTKDGREVGVDYTGIDFSEGLIRVARERYRERAHTTFIVGDALKLPFPDRAFDNAVSFAVLHHIPSHAYRVQFLREAARVVNPGGLIVVTAWNVWHSRPWTVIKFALKKIFGSAYDIGDAILDFGTEKNARYVHALTMHEIRALAYETGLTIERLKKIRRPSGEENFFVMLRVSKV